MPKKQISSETIEELRKDVQGTLQNVLLNADAFVFRAETSAYEPVSVHLRKLLLDGNAPRSYDKKTQHPNLLALAYGGVGKIIVNHGLPLQRSRDEAGREWVPETPCLYSSPGNVIHAAYNGTRQLGLIEWLNEYIVGCYATGCRCPEGKKRSKKVSEIIRIFADKEGAHRLNYDGDRDAAIAIAPSGSEPSIAKLNYDLPWQQFIIESGIRMVFARHVDQGKELPIFDMGWFESRYPHWMQFTVPAVHGSDNLRLQKVHGECTGNPSSVWLG